jgi:invasion protein IalB
VLAAVDGMFLCSDACTLPVILPTILAKRHPLRQEVNACVDTTRKVRRDAPAKAPEVTIAGNFSQWALVCGKEKDKEGREPCSLVQALVQRESQKLVFRVTVAYGPQGNLVLRIDGPTGVALQKGLEFSPDAIKIYRMSYQACVPQQCSALLVMPDDLKQELTKSQKGTITVYALNGQGVQAVAELTGFSDGLAALDKRRPKP